MINVRPFDDMTALPVFRLLDAHDQIEAELVRGQPATALQLWADWRAAEAFRLLSFVALTGPTPFAVFGLSHTGQAGVAGAALLARDHARFRVPLARLCVLIRAHLLAEARARGIRRIEARAWAGHPTAARLLCALGFDRDCTMPGFGPQGRDVYRQFSLLALTPAAADPTPTPQTETTDVL